MSTRVSRVLANVGAAYRAARRRACPCRCVRSRPAASHKLWPARGCSLVAAHAPDLRLPKLARLRVEREAVAVALAYSQPPSHDFEPQPFSRNASVGCTRSARRAGPVAARQPTSTRNVAAASTIPRISRPRRTACARSGFQPSSGSQQSPAQTAWNLIGLTAAKTHALRRRSAS